jgi:[ribosomal protein S18]-alanine N-acetyltransferase
VTRHDAVPPVPATPGPVAAWPVRDAPSDAAGAPGIALRPMTRADLPAVLRLEHDLFGDEAWSEAMLASELEGAEASGRYYLVAEDARQAGDIQPAGDTRPAGDIRPAEDARQAGDTRPAGNTQPTRYAAGTGQLAGYAGLLSPGGGQADILTMAVARERWGQRIGAQLLDALVAEAARRGCTDVFLEVRVDNDRAQRLYRSRGFTQIGIRRGYYQPSGTDALVMQLSLPRPRRFGFSATRRSGTKHGDPKSASGGSR